MTTRQLAAFILENKERSKQTRRSVFEDGSFADNEWYTAFYYERQCFQAMQALNKLEHRYNLSQC